MTNNSPHPFKDFKETVNAYQYTGRAGQSNLSTENRSPDNRRCLQCQRQIVDSSRVSPYCSDQCMNDHDKGIKIDHKGSEKNAMLGFSTVFQ